MSATQPLYTSPRVQVAVYNAFLKKETELNVRKNPYLAAMEAKKRISYGWSKKGPGLEFEWPVAYKGLTATPYADMEPIGATRTNVWTRAKLPWRGYVSKESISLLEKKINDGETSLFRIEEKIYPLQVKAIMDALARDIVGNDGNASGSDAYGPYNERIHGFPSFMGHTGSTVKKFNGAGIVADPNDVYAGLSTALASKGGTWNPPAGLEWPEGTGSYEFSYWSPMLINANSTRFPPGTGATWRSNYKYAFLFANTYLESRFNLKWDAFFLSPHALREAKESLESSNNTHLFVKRGPEESLLVNLGFSPISYEGVDVMSDHNIRNANHYGFGVIFDKMELRCLDDQLIKKDTDKNMDNQADIIAANCFVNLRVESPAFVCAFIGGVTEV